MFAGEARIVDKPVGLPVELAIGRALNVTVEVTLDDQRSGAHAVSVEAEHRIANNKSVPVDIEIRHAVEGGFTDARVDDSSKPMRKKYGDFAWRFAVPPGTEQVLRYRLSALQN